MNESNTLVFYTFILGVFLLKSNGTRTHCSDELVRELLY